MSEATVGIGMWWDRDGVWTSYLRSIVEKCVSLNEQVMGERAEF